MKKLLLIVTAATALSGLSAFGQGYFAFSGAVRGNWDLWSGVPRTSTNNHLAFLWGTGTPLVDAIMNRVATNNATPYDYVAAWTAIMSDANFHLAHNNTDGSIAMATSAGNGAWQYPATGTASFPVTGSAVTAYQVFVIAWGGGFTDPAAAAAAGAPVGWSNPFAYSAVDSIGTPALMPSAGLLPFGVGVIPEPTTFAFAGLGAAALLIFRRRK